VYAEVAAKAVELRDHGKTHMEVCEILNELAFKTRTGKPWRHPQQIVKLLRSFESSEESSLTNKHPVVQSGQS
jgi:hypothetical protein